MNSAIKLDTVSFIVGLFLEDYHLGLTFSYFSFQGNDRKDEILKDKDETEKVQEHQTLSPVPQTQKKDIPHSDNFGTLTPLQLIRHYTYMGSN
jgi:hypothetical protein